MKTNDDQNDSVNLSHEVMLETPSHSYNDV